MILPVDGACGRPSSAEPLPQSCQPVACLTSAKVGGFREKTRSAARPSKVEGRAATIRFAGGQGRACGRKRALRMFHVSHPLVFLFDMKRRGTSASAGFPHPCIAERRERREITDFGSPEAKGFADERLFPDKPRSRKTVFRRCPPRPIRGAPGLPKSVRFCHSGHLTLQNRRRRGRARSRAALCAIDAGLLGIALHSVVGRDASACRIWLNGELGLTVLRRGALRGRAGLACLRPRSFGTRCGCSL